MIARLTVLAFSFQIMYMQPVSIVISFFNKKHDFRLSKSEENRLTSIYQSTRDRAWVSGQTLFLRHNNT